MTAREFIKANTAKEKHLSRYDWGYPGPPCGSLFWIEPKHDGWVWFRQEDEFGGFKPGCIDFDKGHDEYLEMCLKNALSEIWSAQRLFLLIGMAEAGLLIEEDSP